jgi:hypothetical protein
MSGITAVAQTTTHAASGADVSVAGFLVGETIALSTAPTGSSYQWALSAPSNSNQVRSALSGATEATASFTPDASGIYAISVTVDGTVFILRITVTMLAVSTALEALRLLPVADAQISTPAAGIALYYSSTQSALSFKDAAGNVRKVTFT